MTSLRALPSERGLWKRCASRHHAGCGLLLWLLWLGAFAQQAPAPAASYGASTLSYKFVAGDQSVYQLTYKTNADADLRPLFQDQQGGSPAKNAALAYTLSSNLRGLWSVDVVAVRPDRVLTICKLHDSLLSIVINGKQQVSQAEGVRRDLGAGILVETTPSGHVIAVNMGPTTDEFSRDFTLALMAAVEFILPEGAPRGVPGEWRSREEDRSGRYLAVYHITSSAPTSAAAAGVAIVKNKSRYFPEHAKRGAGQLPGQAPAKRTIFPTGSLTMRFDTTTGQIVSIDGMESQETAVAEKKISRLETTVTMTRVSGRMLTSEEASSIRQMAATLSAYGIHAMLYAPPTPEEVQASIQRNALGQETANSLLLQLQAAERENLKSDQTELYLKFKALIYLQPELSETLARPLAASNAQSLTFVVLAKSLGAIGHADAQEALISAMQVRPNDWPALSNLIPTLASVPSPTLAAEEWLYHLAATASERNIASTATLALGSMARNLANREPARSARLVTKLLLLDASSKSEDQTETAIQALGNTASVRALPTVVKFAASPAPRLRAAALDAARSIPSPEADALLLQGLHDPVDDVRLEAAYGLGFRKITAGVFSAQKKALLTEKSDKVRVTLLTNLWSAHKRFETARQVIKVAAEKDPSEYVRKTARSLLLQGD